MLAPKRPLTEPTVFADETALAPTALRRRGILGATVATARPKQWLKNVLVIAAPGAAGALGHDDVPVRVALACLAFCMLASGIYALNDVRDAPEDRAHPVKRFRPVAAGELGPRAATAAGAGWIVAGLLLCVAIRPLLALVAVAYVALTVTYTFLWRHIVGLDILAIAGGFVLRAVAGGVAAPVALSAWFLFVVSCGAVLVAAGKRHAELTRTLGSAAGRRTVHAYSAEVLEAIMIFAAVGAVLGYAIWAFALPSEHGFPWRPLTIGPIVVALIGYGRLIGRGRGEAPEELFLRDRWLQVAGATWLLLFAIGVDAAS